MELFIYLGKSAIILILFYLVYTLLLKKDMLFTANRHYLLAGIIAAIVFPLVAFTKTIYVVAPLPTSLTFSEAIPEIQLIVQETAAINWWHFAILIYSISVLYMCLRFANQLYSLSMLLKEHPSEKIGNYTYIKVPQNSAPFSFFKYLVFNPEIDSQEELAMVLKHEQVHGLQ